mgnify:FL=1
MFKTENIQREPENENVRKSIKQKLTMKVKRKLISEIVSKLNQGNFIKSDFNKLSKDKNVSIKKLL